MGEVAFYLMVWIFAVQHPGGSVSERQWSFDETYKTEVECNTKADLASSGVKLENLTTDGGDALYSRFACIPVPAAAVAAFAQTPGELP